MTTTNYDEAVARWMPIMDAAKLSTMTDAEFAASCRVNRERSERELAEAKRKDEWVDAEPERQRERDERAAREKEAGRAEATRRAFLACRIPPRHMGTTPDQSGPWGGTTAQLVASWRADTGLMVALIGPRGTGKTQAAVELLKASCKDGIPSRYCKAMEIFLTIKATFAQKTGDEVAALKEFSKPAVLVIDEMQVRSESEWENNILTHIVDDRYSNGLATIIISNLTHDAFRKNVGESIYSRFTEQGGIVTYDGTNFRAGAFARPAPATIRPQAENQRYTPA